MEAILSAIFRRINRRVYWHKLPWPIGLLNLIALRVDLRRNNLHDTMVDEPIVPPIGKDDPDPKRFRTLNGSRNDSAVAAMGMERTRFGRNIPVKDVRPDPMLMEPNPRTISRRLMQRTSFQPAPTLNLLAAAWLQFQIHDWVTRDKNSNDPLYKIPIEPGDDWGPPEMIVSSTKVDRPNGRGEAGGPLAFLCKETHWWDASQLYGATPDKQRQLRVLPGCKLKLTEDGRLPVDQDGFDITGNNNNWWFGLSVMHTLFSREHNAVCDRLAAAYPSWDDERRFHTARLVVTALIAKIHTIEWTPALLNTKLLRIGMRGNWWGILGEWVRKHIGRVTSSDIFSGIMGSETDHNGVRFAITEEFVAVYRMHPLMPDEFVISNLKTGDSKTYSLTEVAGRGARQVIDEQGIETMLNHLGTANPGALRLRNYPKALRKLVTQEEKDRVIDLAAVDILRDRERGIPRYNDFRAMLRMPRIERFEDLTDDPDLAKEIEAVYGGDIDKVDMLVGCLAETPPKNFAFSDTAFRIFILMASRRLKSDRFFTTDFTPEIYSEVGMKWVMDTTFTDVLRRHFPAVASAISADQSPFAPWKGRPS